MRKTFATDDHKQLMEASGGKAFQFFDRSDKITKSASDSISRADIQTHMPPDSHFGVHLITMGAEETYGANRNGDSASIGSLEKYHPTFEKHGCVFREHANRNQKTQGVGQVKLARFNPKMSRGELIVWVDKDKAPDMYKSASDGKELSWSMSMRLPHDECSCCRKKSPRVSDYCAHLKNDMLQYVPKFEKFAYARNEEGVKFFDISEVKKRADRIATYLGYSFSDGDMAKAASDSADMVITGSEWADQLLGVDEVIEFSPWEKLTLEKLAEAADFVRNGPSDILPTLVAMGPRDLTQDHLDVLATQDFRNVSGELAKKAMILNFKTFASLVTDTPIAEMHKNADFNSVEANQLPKILENLLRDGGSGCGDDVASAVTPDDCGCSFSPGKDNIDRLMTEVGEELGMSNEKSKGRVLNITIIKKASLKRVDDRAPAAPPFYDALIAAYGHYLVKVAHTIKDLPDVSENTLHRVIAASLLT